MDDGDIGSGVIDVVSQTEQHPCTTLDVLAVLQRPLIFNTVDLVGKSVVAVVLDDHGPFVSELRSNDVAKRWIHHEEGKRQERKGVEEESLEPRSFGVVFLETLWHDHTVNLWNENQHGERQDVEDVRLVKGGRWHQHKTHHHRDDEGIGDDEPHRSGLGSLLVDVFHGIKRFDAKVGPRAAFLLLRILGPITLHALGLSRRHGRFEVHHEPLGGEQVLEHCGCFLFNRDGFSSDCSSDLFKEGMAHPRDRPGWRSW